MRAKLQMAPNCSVNLDPMSGVCPAAHSAQKDQMERARGGGQAGSGLLPPAVCSGKQKPHLPRD